MMEPSRRDDILLTMDSITTIVQAMQVSGKVQKRAQEELELEQEQNCIIEPEQQVENTRLIYRNTLGGHVLNSAGHMYWPAMEAHQLTE